MRHLAATTKKLVLIEPGAPGKHIYSGMKLPRIGAVLLGTIARNLGWEVTVFVEDIAPVDYSVVLAADVVGISSLTSTASRSYAIADALRLEGIPVIMGGPHVTFLSEEALGYCDYVIRGEGEVAFPAFLGHFTDGTPLEQVPSLSYHGPDGAILENPMAPPVEDLDALPWPDFSLIHGWSLTTSFSTEPIIPIQASRGCPFACSFCSVVSMFGRRMRLRSVEDILGEIEQYRDKGVHLFFYDDNFTANKRWTRELLTRALERGVPWHSWSAQVRTDATEDPELLALMERTHCSNVYIGFESVNPEALKEMKKQQTVTQMKRSVQRFKEHGLDIHGMFVFGFDSDTLSTVDATIRFALDSGICSAQFLILTPLPGTPLYAELEREGRLLDSEWANFDTHHVVFRPRLLSPWDLQMAQIRAHSAFYSLTRTLRNFVSLRFASGALYLYAMRLNLNWQKTNGHYLKALEIEKAVAPAGSFSFSFTQSQEPVYHEVRQAGSASR